MKNLLLILIFSLILALGDSKRSKRVVVEISSSVLEVDSVLVESEQTQLLQEMREEVDELYETTYKLNRLLLHNGKAIGEENEFRHTTTSNRDTH